jgi:hypothetical protein
LQTGYKVFGHEKVIFIDESTSRNKIAYQYQNKQRKQKNERKEEKLFEEQTKEVYRSRLGSSSSRIFVIVSLMRNSSRLSFLPKPLRLATSY